MIPKEKNPIRNSDAKSIKRKIRKPQKQIESLKIYMENSTNEKLKMKHTWGGAISAVPS